MSKMIYTCQRCGKICICDSNDSDKYFCTSCDGYQLVNMGISLEEWEAFDPLIKEKVKLFMDFERDCFDDECIDDYDGIRIFSKSFKRLMKNLEE